MNRVLESRFSEAQTLPESEQEWLSDFMGQCIGYFQNARQRDEALKDPTYREYVEGVLDQAEEQRQAGEFMLMREAMDNLKAKFKEDYGL